MKNRFFIFSIWLGFVSNFIAHSQVLVPGSGSNFVSCNTTLCDHAGCSTGYSNGQDGYTIIAGRTGETINIDGSYTLESGCSCDYIKIYTGAGTGGALVENRTNGSGTINYTGTTGQTLTVRFISDAGATAAGFSFTITYSGTCPGATTLVSGSGTNNVSCGTNSILKDHAGDGGYSNSQDHYSVINSLSSAVVTISGAYNLESGCSCDYIRIYSGSGIGGALLASYTNGPGVINYSGTAGQTLTVRFTSDGGVTASGFSLNATYSGSCSSPYQTQWISMNVGSATWCSGETRNVTVTVKNNGTSPWPDASPDINIGCKWNAEADYFVRVNAGNLAAGSQQVYTLSMTAPGVGTNNLTFDVVKEGDCWFGNNSGSCGPGNSVYASGNLTIISNPGCAGLSSPSNGATNQCPNSGTTLNWTAASGSPSGYKLFFGTDNPPTNIVNGSNLGAVLTYNPMPLSQNTTYYWKIVPTNSCGDASGCSVWSFSTGYPCYCTPTYSAGCSNTVDVITRVRFGTLDNTTTWGTTCPTRYVDYTGSVGAPVVSKSSLYNLMITVGNDAGNYTAAWFDWNQDGDFADGGEYFNGGNPGGNGTATIPVTIPAGATSGTTRMRVRGGEDSDINLQSYACNASPSGFGEAEDYFINICTTPSAPTANAATSIQCAQFTANWTAVGGATSYRLDVATDAGFSSYVSGFNDLNVGNVTTYNVTGLSSGTNYWYRVRTYTSCVSGNSNVISTTTTAEPVAPTLSAASPVNTSTICAGYNIGTVTGTGGSGGGSGAANEYQYSINGGSTYSAYTNGSAINSTGATTSVIVQARRTGGTGCSNTAWTTICTWTVGSATSLPSLITSTPASSTTICAAYNGPNATINTGSGGSSGASDTYQYSLNNGSTWNAYTSGSTINTTGATTNVLIRVSRSGGSYGCSAVGPNTIVTWPVGSATQAPTINTATPAGGTTICEGYNGPNVTINAGSGGSSGSADSYQYSLNNGSTWNAYTSGSTINTAGATTNVLVRVSRSAGSYGCSTAGPNTIATWPVNQKSGNPTSALAGSSSICAGGSTTLTLNGGGGGTGETVKWYTISCGNTLAATGQGATISPSTTTTYYGRYENGSPCNYNSICQSVTVTVLSSFSAGSITGGGGAYCLTGDPTTMTANPSGGSGSFTYQWYYKDGTGCPIGGGETIIAGATSQTYDPPAGLTVTRSYQCKVDAAGSPDCGVSTWASNCVIVTIDVTTPSSVDAGEDQYICNTTNATVTGTGGTSGTWSILNGTGSITIPGTINPNAVTVTNPNSSVTFRYNASNSCGTSFDDLVIMRGQ